jgi:hypothetical protein
VFSYNTQANHRRYCPLPLSLALVAESGDVLLRVLDEAPEDTEAVHPDEEEGSNRAVAEYHRGEARAPDGGGQPSRTPWRILVTPEAGRDLEQRAQEINSVDTRIRTQHPDLYDRISHTIGTSVEPDANRYYFDRLRQLIERPESFRPQRLSRFPRYDVIILHRCRAHQDQWIVGPGRSRVMVDRRAGAVILLKALRGAAYRPTLIRKLLNIRFLPMFIKQLRAARRSVRPLK